MALKIHIENDPRMGLTIEQFAARLIAIKSDIWRYRHFDISRDELYSVAHTFPPLTELFRQKLEKDSSVNLRNDLRPYLTAKFDGVVLIVHSSSTTESLVESYEEKVAVLKKRNN